MVLMTYLNIVNNVLRRMREDEVTSVQESTYSKMVGDFVNDAKRIVEDSWDWSALRTTLTITTTADIFNYVLTGSQNRIKALNVINDTANLFMEYRPATFFDEAYLISDPRKSAPTYYTYNGIDSNGDTQIDIYPTPEKEYAIRFNCIQRSADLSTNSDQLTVPAMPVMHLAIALLARERGETGGTSASEYFTIANQYLSDAIALDAQKHPEEVIFYTP
tara:strand:+ start:216 stop:872 length:657 start_codon:yes stop_codon:yes gene_type:complete